MQCQEYRCPMCVDGLTFTFRRGMVVKEALELHLQEARA